MMCIDEESFEYWKYLKSGDFEELDDIHRTSLYVYKASSIGLASRHSP